MKTGGVYGAGGLVQVLLIAASASAAYKSCDDCVVYTECSAYDSKLSNDKTNEIIQGFICGTEDFDNIQNVPKVCCSMWTAPKVESVGTRWLGALKRPESPKNLWLLPTECGRGASNYRIVGGQVADILEFPWMALIQYSTRQESPFLCGGSIINSRHILTAAHCVKNRIIKSVRLGEFDLSTSKDCQYKAVTQTIICREHLQDVPVEAEIVHEEYNAADKSNDIALLRLKTVIDFTHDNVGPICLPINEDLKTEAKKASSMTVAGWGITDNGIKSNVLLKTTVEIYSEETCNETVTRHSNRQFVICASAKGSDACSGDSGGPMMYNKEYSGVYSVIQGGIISQGPHNCGNSMQSSINTDVSQYMEWILDHLVPDIDLR